MGFSITAGVDAEGPRLRGSAAELRLIKHQRDAYGSDIVMTPDMSSHDILRLTSMVADPGCVVDASVSVTAERRLSGCDRTLGGAAVPPHH